VQVESAVALPTTAGPADTPSRWANQYLIASIDRGEDNLELPKSRFGPLTIYHHPALRVTVARHESTEILLLGYVLDPSKPLSSDFEILDALARSCPGKAQLFERLQSLSGRFVLLFSTPDEFVALNDACGSRRIYYSLDPAGLVLTSSIDMFRHYRNSAPEVSPAKREILESSEYERAERAWIGAESPDDRLWKVLPNHYLDLNRRSVSRIPVDVRQLIDESSLCEYSATVLRESLRAALSRFEAVAQPLTAGWDSRGLLAASRDFLSSIDLFVFARPDQDETWPDVSIPMRVSRRLNLRLTVIRPGSASKDFLSGCERAGIVQQGGRAPEIQYLFNRYAGREAVRVAGLAAGVLKSSFFGHSRQRITSDVLYAFTPYYGRSPFVKRQVEEWHASAGPFCDQHDVQVADLYYWEQRLGNWGAQYAFEQDVAMEEFWPHGNRTLLLSIMRLDPRKRSRPKCEFFRKLITALWAETLLEPCNPLSLTAGLKWRLRNNSWLRYYKLRFFG
jgi:hypothetical protein